MLNSSSPTGLITPEDWEVKVNDGQRVKSICSRCWDEHYKRGAPVPDKQKLEWSREERCPNCGIEALILETVNRTNLDDGRQSQRQEIFRPCPNCGVGFARIELNEYIQISDELGLKSRSVDKVRGKPREELVHKAKSNGYQLRYIRSRFDKETIVAQVGWDGGNLDHIHCKTCGNEWRRRDNYNFEEKFVVQISEFDQYRITCKICSHEYAVG